MNTSERHLFQQAVEAVCALTCELAAIREQRKHELVTKCDLADAECRIRSAIDAAKRDIIKAISESSPEKPRVRFHFSIGLPQNKETQGNHMDVRISNEQKVTVTLSPKTDTGKPAKLDGKPSWTVISGNSTIIQAEDGMSADLVSSDDPGDTEIIVKADADLGEGVEEISEIIKLIVSSAGAKNLGITVGPPEAKDDITPA